MSVIVIKSETTEYRILVKAGDEELARKEAVKAAISAEEARLSAIEAGASEQVATQKAAQTVEDAASALASKQEAESAATDSGGFATNSGISATNSNTAKGLSEAAKVIAIQEAEKSSTSAGQSAASAAAAEAAKNIVLANIIDPATQIEVSGNVTALEAWRNKVIIVTNDSTITIPSALFTANWTFRVIVRNGFIQIAKLGAKTFPFGNPEPLINPKSDFTIRQRGLTQEVLITGNIISTYFEAEFQTQNTLAGGSNEFQVRLQFSSASFQTVIVDWGDGVVESMTTFNDPNFLHSYAIKGAYRIKIYGSSFMLRFLNGSERLKIGELFSWGGLLLSIQSFFGCDNLTADNVTDVLTNISTNIGLSFANCSKLTKVNRINEWPTQNVISIGSMFQVCPLFNQKLEFNTPSLTEAGGFLNFASLFNELINIETKNITNFFRFLRGAAAFNQNIGHLDVSKGTSFGDFMNGKTFSNYSTTNYNAILNGWTERAFALTGLTFDFGTIRRTAAGTEGRALMTRASATVNITNAVNNGSGLIRITAAGHGMINNNKVFISGVLGTISANKGWVVTVIDANTIDLQGSLFVNAYASGGTVRTGWAHTIIDGGI